MSGRVQKASEQARTVLGLELLGLALGSITFVTDPLGFPDPALALYSIASMLLLAVLAHAVPALRRRARLTHAMEVAALFLYATLLTLSTGATASPFIALYALALFTAALMWKPWQVAALALATIGLTLLQSGFWDSMNDLHLPTTVMLLLIAVAPAAAAAAALIIARGQRRIAALERLAEQLSREAPVVEDCSERQRPAGERVAAHGARRSEARSGQCRALTDTPVAP